MASRLELPQQQRAAVRHPTLHGSAHPVVLLSGSLSSTAFAVMAYDDGHRLTEALAVRQAERL